MLFLDARESEDGVKYGGHADYSDGGATQQTRFTLPPHDDDGDIRLFT